MNRIAGSPGAVLYRELKRRYVPWSRPCSRSCSGLFPAGGDDPARPDIGFLVLLTWRLLRPEIWMPTVALALGLFDDLVSGIRSASRWRCGPCLSGLRCPRRPRSL
jgi:hypothetical protein